MTFDEVTGVLSGTPTASGTFQFKVTAIDGINPDVSKNYTLRIAAAGAALPPASLLDTAAIARRQRHDHGRRLLCRRMRMPR